ncbi:MAG TPA: universal stress protein [Intrasporangium sp.]|uniref:universal stress protein n=1 Tax=Intrasporangium sp. TaxID=1925024 RepID=UPI002D76B6ED|nr:universal stress protein [Intrasporangium sp.]HET7397643.1 universal stress protein [Intrasporangium sp.]
MATPTGSEAQGSGRAGEGQQEEWSPASDGDPVPDGAVVVGLDGSEKDSGPLAFAVAEARRGPAPLHLLSAHDIHAGLIGSWDAGFLPIGMDLELATAREAALARAVERLHADAPDLPVTASHPWATPSQALLDAAAAARLVVVGSGRSGRSGPVDTVRLGTTSLDTAMHARCPVAVVGADPGIQGHVVVGVDGSAHSLTAVAYAAEAAAARGQRLVVVATWWLEVVDGMVVTEVGTPEWEVVEQRHRHMADDAVAPSRAAYPDLPVEVVVRNARPVAALLEAAEGAALLVVGSRGRGGFAGMSLGSVSHKVLQRATCPVVVTKARQR